MHTNYPVLGRILDDSPAQRSGELHVGDKILAGWVHTLVNDELVSFFFTFVTSFIHICFTIFCIVNSVDVLHLHHAEIVQMIKESGNSVTLTVLPQHPGVPGTFIFLLIKFLKIILYYYRLFSY